MFESHQTDHTLIDVMFFQLYVMSQKFCYFMLFFQEKPMNPQQSLSGPKEDEEGMFFMIFLQFSLSLNKFSIVFVTAHFSSQKLFALFTQGPESWSSAYLSNYSFSTSDFSYSSHPLMMPLFLHFCPRSSYPQYLLRCFPAYRDTHSTKSHSWHDTYLITFHVILNYVLSPPLDRQVLESRINSLIIFPSPLKPNKVS